MNTNKTTGNEKKQRRAITAVCISVITFFCAIIFGVFLLSAIFPDREKSENENRVLKQFPKFSLSALFDGSFTKNLEIYLNDQFPFRDSIITLKTKVDRIAGKTEENGVYIGKDKFLFEAPAKADNVKLKELTKAITGFSRKNKKLKKAFILSPNASDILPEKLPTALKPGDRSGVFSFIRKNIPGVSWIDCKGVFEKQKNKSDLFYRTDHHWTTRAAYLSFNELSSLWSLGAKKRDFSFYPVSASFQGTLSSSAAVNDAADIIEICVPKKQAGKYTVLYESSSRKTASLFEKEKLSQKNQYEVFLGGNHDKVIISTAADTPATLLVLKDSYANCMLPMLTPYFSKIVVIDPRYFSDSLKAVMSETKFTHVLFVYNMDTLLGDTSLVPTLKG